MVRRLAACSAHVRGFEMPGLCWQSLGLCAGHGCNVLLLDKCRQGRASQNYDFRERVERAWAA